VKFTDAITPLHVRGVPELVVEIASKRTRKRDETIKHRRYDRMGVTEYWIIDPTAEPYVFIDERRQDSIGRSVSLAHTATS
jgi:Uma2 family endonuclease